MKHFFGLVILAFIPSLFLNSQVPMNAWRDHFPYKHAKDVITVKGRIYAATDRGIFYYIKKTGELRKLSKANVLSDIDISAIEKIPSRDAFIIAYENANIDIYEGHHVTNIPDIKQSAVHGERKVHNISFRNNEAWLSTDIGIIVLDIQKKEVKETYSVGSGEGLKILETTFFNEYIYAAAEDGLYKAPLEGVNLLDFNNWELVSDFSDSNNAFVSVTTFNDYLFTIQKTSANNTLHKKRSSSVWERFNDMSISDPLRLLESRNKLIVIEEKNLSVFNQNLKKKFNFSDYGYGVPDMNDAVFDSDQKLWVADNYYGLIMRKREGAVGTYKLNAPSFASVNDIVAKKGDVWVAAGSPDNRFSEKGMYRFSEGKWKNFNRYTYDVLDTVKNISSLAIDPNNHNRVCGGSYGYGIVEFENAAFNIYNEIDYPLETVPGFDHGYAFIADVAFDNTSDLWITSSQTENPVFEMKQNGDWNTYNFDNTNFGFEKEVGDILITESGVKWLILPNFGFIVFDGKGHREKLPLKDENGEHINAQINCFAQDKNGNIWAGTSKGIVVYYSPENVFRDNNYTASRIIVENRYLLEFESITDIYVDGGNRKWIGTRNSGVFFIGENGKKQIHHFNAQNSPIPSNIITSIGINEESGEVFIGTGKGLVSYKSNATEGNDNYEDVYVYPNPVRESFDGEITITGLMNNTVVKITDVAGNLVFEDEANGGTLTWDGKNSHGQRVNTGVYFVFCGNKGGNNSCVTKFMVINK